MQSFSNYLRNKIVDHTLRGLPYAPPAQLWVRLYTTATSDNGGGTEVTGGGYAPVSIPCTTTAWAGTQGAGSTAASAGTTGLTSNNVVVNLPLPSADWGPEVTHWALWDAQAGGNMHFHGALAESKTIIAGAPLSFQAGAIQIIIGANVGG